MGCFVMAHLTASEIAARLGNITEAVCAHYLSAGRREGNYWIVGDVRNTAGRSMFVHLRAGAEGRPPGKWRDAATGEHGDLLDVIRESCGLVDVTEAIKEARRFLAMPEVRSKAVATRLPSHDAHDDTKDDPVEKARRLFAIGQPIRGTLAAQYLRGRGISADEPALRFVPRCYYRRAKDAPTEIWPALVAAVTDVHGAITGVNRTWLDPRGFTRAMLGKAPLESPRKAMGGLLGNAVRFGTAFDVLAAGEGIESVLSCREVLPAMPMAAALTGAHLAGLRLPSGLRRLYVLRDADPAGDIAAEKLVGRAEAENVEVIVLSPALEDFNEDLRINGRIALRDHLLAQLAADDVNRFLAAA